MSDPHVNDAANAGAEIMRATERALSAVRNIVVERNHYRFIAARLLARLDGYASPSVLYSPDACPDCPHEGMAPLDWRTIPELADAQHWRADPELADEQSVESPEAAERPESHEAPKNGSEACQETLRGIRASAEQMAHGLRAFFERAAEDIKLALGETPTDDVMPSEPVTWESAPVGSVKIISTAPPTGYRYGMDMRTGQSYVTCRECGTSTVMEFGANRDRLTTIHTPRCMVVTSFYAQQERKP